MKNLKTIPGRITKHDAVDVNAYCAIWTLIKRTVGWSWIKERSYPGIAFKSGSQKHLVNDKSLAHGDYAVFPEGFRPEGAL